VLVPLTATAAADTPVGDYTGVIRYGQGGDGGVDLDGPPVIIHVVAPDAVDAPAATLPASPLVSTEQLVLGVRQPKPRPKFGQTQLISRVKGKVTFRTPGGPARSLGDPMIVPNGTVVDASDGVVKVAVERAKGGTLDSADAWGGSFHMSQSAGGVTTFKLTGAVTSSRSASASKVSAKRSLWVNGKGNFKTRGKRASAIVRGTYWFTQETTAGTKVQVKRGLVAVRDFVRKRTTLVGAGHSYVARPRATVVRRVPAFAGENARR
jgi:hypothetical protein